MNRVDLLDALVSEFKQEFAGYFLPNKDAVMQEVKVYSQYLPQPQNITYTERERRGLAGYEENDYATNFPCVIVRLEDMTDSEEGSTELCTVRVQVIAGVYDDTPESQGYRHILAMQDKIRLLLLDRRVIGRKFLLDMPVKSKLLDIETWPVWYGQQELTYHAGRPLQNWEYVHGGIKRIEKGSVRI